VAWFGDRELRSARASAWLPAALGGLIAGLSSCSSDTATLGIADTGVPIDGSGGWGGATGAAGSSAGSAGMDAPGGGAGSRPDASDVGGDASLEPFPCFAVKPLAPTITDFSGTDPTGRWGDPISFGGGVYSYGGSGDAGLDLTATVDLVAQNFHVTGHVTTYSGFGLYFDECADASDYRGITFKLSGTVAGGGLRFVPTVNETTPIDPVNMIGSCSYSNEITKFTECVNPGATITASGKVTVLWDALSGGRPRATVNPAQLRGLQWVLVWAPGLPSYAVDLTLDDVAFVTAADAAVEASADATDGGAADTTGRSDASAGQ